MFARSLVKYQGRSKTMEEFDLRENLGVRGVGVDPPVLTFPNFYIHLQRDEQFGGSFQVLFSRATCEGYRLKVPSRQGM